MKTLSEKMERQIMKIDFRTAKEYADQLVKPDLLDALLGADSRCVRNARSLAFVYYLLAQEASPRHHELAFMIWFVVFPGLGEGYRMAAYHVQKLLELTGDDIYKETLLSFYSIPGHFISFRKAKKLADDILSHDPNNETALAFFDDWKEGEDSSKKPKNNMMAKSRFQAEIVKTDFVLAERLSHHLSDTELLENVLELSEKYHESACGIGFAYYLLAKKPLSIYHELIGLIWRSLPSVDGARNMETYHLDKASELLDNA